MGMASDRVVPVRILASVKQQRHYGDMPMLRSQRLRGPEGIGPERYSGATRGLPFSADDKAHVVPTDVTRFAWPAGPGRPGEERGPSLVLRRYSGAIRPARGRPGSGLSSPGC